MDNQKQECRAAGRELSLWVKKNGGHPARRMKGVGQLTLHHRRYYLFRYKRSFFSRDLLLGVGGGYLGDAAEGCGHTGGEIPYQPDTALKDAARLIEIRREYWMRQARGISESEAAPSAEVQQLISMLAPGNGSHSFICSVLLQGPAYDPQRLCAQLKADWGWPDSAARIQAGGSVAIDRDGLLGALSLVAEPSLEAQQYSVNNLHWEGAMAAAGRHTAYLQLAIMGTENARKTACGLSQLCASCLTQPGALAVHAAGTLFPPQEYRDEALLLLEDRLPVRNWVYFGVSQNHGMTCAFTYGMEQLGLPEMEVSGSLWESALLEDFLCETARYALQCSRPFHTGEAAGFCKGEKYAIQRSPGISVDGMSLKILIP